ncbi:hypothetical protein [Bifidobacterium ruminantium]|uniref:hypothetical protein n=1 Tax=Bifidobacterium ruminantium TaxID=78346 RepID=UPI0024920166|nr:hypothetical protein [Bifidobacterium ruminantium]
MTNALDEVRERLWNQARCDGDDKAVKRMRGVEHAVSKNPGDLTGRREETFGNLLKHPVDQAGAELKRWVFRAPHSRIKVTIRMTPMASTTSAASSRSSCSAAADSTYTYHHQEPNPRKQQKPLNSSIPLQRSHHGIRTPTRVCVHDSSNEPYPPLDGRLQYRDAMR